MHIVATAWNMMQLGELAMAAFHLQHQPVPDKKWLFKLARYS